MGMIGNSLAQGLISGANIQDGTVDTPDIKDSAVTAAKIASAVITPAKLSTGAPTWDANSNVGVGVTLSSWDTTYKAIQVGARSMFFGIGSEANMANNAYFNSGYKYVANSAAGLYTIDANIHEWFIAPSGTAGNAITFTQAMTLNASGNLGIGTTSPGAKLEVNDATRASVFVQDSAGRRLRLQSPDSSGNPATVGTSTNHDLLIEAGSSGAGANTMRFNTAGSERMRLDANGNLGIGTTSPSNYAGYGTFTLNGSSGGEIDFKVSNTLYADMYANTTGLFIRAQQNTPMMLWAGGAERARITNSGDLLINTTSNSFSASVLIYANSALRNAVVCVDTGTNYGTGYYYQWFVNSAGNSAGSISHTAATTIAFLTSSDKRLKHNIVDAPSALQKVNDVKVCSFDWIEDGHHVDYGFIAQDLYKVIPEAVGKGDDTETIEDPKGTWQVEYGRLTPILFKAIQEQQAIIESLTERITALEGA